MVQGREHAVLEGDEVRAGLRVDGQPVNRSRRDLVIGRVRYLDIVGRADVVEDAGLKLVVDADDRKANAVDAYHLSEPEAAAEKTALERLADQRDVLRVLNLRRFDPAPFAQSQRVDDIVLLTDDRADVRHAVGLHRVVALVGRKDVPDDVAVFREHRRGVAILDLRRGRIVLTRVGENGQARLADSVERAGAPGGRAT